MAAAAPRPNRRRARPSAAPADPVQPMAPFKLDETLDLSAAAGLKAALLECRGADLRVDASAVQHLGGLCAQVLAAAATSWAADGLTFTFPAASDAFEKGATLLGLRSILLCQGART